MQPGTGCDTSLAYEAMGRKSKKNRPPAIVLSILADNVSKLRDIVYKELPTVTARNRELAKASFTTLSQVQRIAKAELAAGADMIEHLANALKVRPQDLLTPYFANSPKGDGGGNGNPTPMIQPTTTSDPETSQTKKF